MLELDYEHRAGGNLPAQLRARIRWEVARANQCAYGQGCARADFLAAGGTDTGLLDLTVLPHEERAVLSFARKLTVESRNISDDEVAALVQQYGNNKLVEMTLLVAYANFLDRLVLSLNLPAEESALPPKVIRFTLQRLLSEGATPAKREAPRQARAVEPLPALDTDWLAMDFNRLQKAVASQHGRRSRVPLPAGQQGNQWGLVCRTYQPRLADVWAVSKRAYESEGEQDPIFAASLFWVVTRTQQSFY